jgi:hypothetical protein
VIAPLLLAAALVAQCPGGRCAPRPSYAPAYAPVHSYSYAAPAYTYAPVPLPLPPTLAYAPNQHGILIYGIPGAGVPAGTPARLIRPAASPGGGVNRGRYWVVVVSLPRPGGVRNYVVPEVWLSLVH